MTARLDAALLLFKMTALCGPVSAAPVNGSLPIEKLTVRATRGVVTQQVLKAPLVARVLSDSLKWDYIQGSSVPVPYVTLKIDNVPVSDKITVLVSRSTKLPRNPSEGYTLSLPIFRKANSLTLTIVDEQGNLEEWSVELTLKLDSTLILVDETCAEYLFKIRELKRPTGPNLMYIGCKAGSGSKDLALDILWGDIEKIQHDSSTITAENLVITLPLSAKLAEGTEIAGIDKSNIRSVYSITYVPVLASPVEIWAGPAFYRTTFEQSNFASKHTQIGTAFMGQVWFKPPDLPAILVVRGYGTLLSFNDKLDPPQDFQESVQTYFANAELRYRVYDGGGWKLDPLAGGWVYFMKVKSEMFGIQRIISSVWGFSATKFFGKRDLGNFTVRFAPLQSYFNPLQFSMSQAYLELTAIYIHLTRGKHRFFGTTYLGIMNFAPEGFAQTNGTFLVIGGGYGW